MRALTGLALAGTVAFAAASPALAAGDPVAGKAVFKAKCGSCHTLKAAGTVARSANQGPTLDRRAETTQRVMKALAGGK